jgi:PTS system nitrogen regulatory IIA component
MDMSVADVAKMLQVSQKTIYRWLSKGKIPAYRLNEQYRFDRNELLQWVVAQKLNAPDELLEESVTMPAPPPDLSGAVERGGVIYRIAGRTREAALLEITNLLKLPPHVDRQRFYHFLEARERLGSTALGGGLAIPHSRQALIPGLTESSITVCFLDQPIPYGALDGQPVHTLFVLVAHSLKEHLGLLSRLVFALRDEALRATLQRQASRDEIYTEFRRVEAALTQS